MDAASPLPEVERHLLEHFGQRPSRASVSFVGVEPIDVLRFEPVPDERVYVTLGMSRHPMTGVDATLMAVDGPRAELVLHVRDPLDAFGDVWRRLAVLAAAPAVEGVVWTDGMTVEIGEPLATGSRCVGVVATTSAIPVVLTTAGAVDLLRVVPATSTELARARIRGASDLWGRWVEHDTDLFDLARSSAPIS